MAGHSDKSVVHLPALRSPPGWLLLAVRNVQGQGHTIHVHGETCRVGAAPTCTIRLTTPLAKPIHCVIWRRRDRVFARSCVSRDRLNGLPFSQSELKPGDRLNLAGIELHVLALSGNRSPSRADPPLARWPAREQTAEPATRPDQPCDQDRRESATASDLDQFADRLRYQIELMERRLISATCSKPVAPPSGFIPESALQCLVRELADQRACQAAEHRQWTVERETLQATLSELKCQLAATHSLLEQQRRRCDAAESTCHQLDEQIRRLEQEQQRREGEIGQWHHQQQLWDHHRIALEERAAEQEQELDRLRRELATLQANREQWEHQRQQLVRELADREQQLAEHHERLAELERSIHDEKQTWFAQREMLQTELSEARQLAAAPHLSAEVTRLEGELLELKDEVTRLEQEVTYWQDQAQAPIPLPPVERDSSDQPGGDCEDSQWAPPTTSGTRPDASSAAEEIDEDPANEQLNALHLAGFPLPADDDLEPFQFPTEFPEVESPPSESNDEPDEPGLELPAITEEPIDAEPVPAVDDNPLLETSSLVENEASLEPETVTKGDSEENPDDDASIEAYMRRLLTRVQGYSSDTSPATGEPDNATSAGPTPSPGQTSEPDQEAAKVTELVPRHVAPERSKNLRDMRDLANSTARRALIDHARRKYSQQVFARLRITLMILACGAVFAWAFRHSTALAALGLLTCVGAMLWWLAQAVMLRQKVRQMMLEEADRLAAHVCSPDDEEDATMPASEGMPDDSADHADTNSQPESEAVAVSSSDTTGELDSID